MRALAPLAIIALVLAAAGAAQASRESDAAALAAARREAAEAIQHYQALDREAQRATSEADRALVYGEQAQVLERDIGPRDYQAALGARLARLPGPVPRPAGAAAPPGVAEAEALPYSLPVQGRVVTGVGEISDGGVHARGLTFETAAEAAVVAPAAGRIVYAAPFRGYGQEVIIDHGRGWMTVLTDLAAADVHPGDTVARGAPIGRAGSGNPHVTVELRRNGQPLPVAQLIGG